MKYLISVIREDGEVVWARELPSWPVGVRIIGPGEIVFLIPKEEPHAVHPRS